MNKKSDLPQKTAEELIPAEPGLLALRQSAAKCRACHLWEKGTQTVFGEGTQEAKVMFVGEQPGSDEDVAGKPFVGPTGRLLGEAMESAGIDRAKAYVTNVVKHFKWEEMRGKRRIHAKPNSKEIAACRPWLEAEIAAVHPKVIVCLGATAAQTLLGKDFRVSTQRGKFVSSHLAPRVLATVHPSSILRAPDGEARRQEKERFVEDLKNVAEVLEN